MAEDYVHWSLGNTLGGAADAGALHHGTTVEGDRQVLGWGRRFNIKILRNLRSMPYLCTIALSAALRMRILSTPDFILRNLTCVGMSVRGRSMSCPPGAIV